MTDLEIEMLEVALQTMHEKAPDDVFDSDWMQDSFNILMSMLFKAKGISEHDKDALEKVASVKAENAIYLASIGKKLYRK